MLWTLIRYYAYYTHKPLPQTFNGYQFLWIKENSTFKKFPNGDQCDRMARIFFQYLANYTNENFLNTKRGLPKLVQDCAK